MICVQVVCSFVFLESVFQVYFIFFHFYGD